MRKRRILLENLPGKLMTKGDELLVYRANKGQNNSENILRKEDITVVDVNIAKKAVVATALGNGLEWFDFGIYSFLAVTMGKVFFSEMSSSLQLISTFATFASAFLVRPLGGMVLGRLGDRVGRKKILTITFVMMALATLSIGLIPSYSTIGALAPILLLLARMLQGFSAGGEYAGAMTFIAESTPDKKRGFMSSGLEVGTTIGFIIGAGIVTLLTFSLGDAKMLEWGWRIPFFIAGPTALIGYYFRSRLEETPVFKAMQAKTEEGKKQGSIKSIFSNHWRVIVNGMILVFFYNVVDYMVLSYMPAHLNAVLGYSETKGLILLLVAMILMVPFILLSGYLSDRIGNKKIIQFALIGVVLLSIPAFKMISSGVTWEAFVGLMIVAVMCAAFQGTMPAFLPSLFFTEVRYGALAITYNVSASLFGGTTPLLMTWLDQVTGNHMVPAYYLVVSCLIGIAAMIFVKETSGKSLRGSAPAVESKNEIPAVLKDLNKALWWKEEKIKIDEKLEDSKTELSI
jgi:MFS transporter, MHS family, proline/betaine transporter